VGRRILGSCRPAPRSCSSASWRRRCAAVTTSSRSSSPGLVFLFLEVAPLVVSAGGCSTSGSGFVQCGRVHHGARRPLVRRARHASGEPRPRTIEAVSGLMNLVMLPMWILSGAPSSRTRRFPTRCSRCEGAPAHRADDALRAVMIDGSRLRELGGRVRHRDGMGESVSLSWWRCRSSAGVRPPARPRRHFPHSSARSRTRGPATAAGVAEGGGGRIACGWLTRQRFTEHVLQLRRTSLRAS